MIDLDSANPAHQTSQASRSRDAWLWGLWPFVRPHGRALGMAMVLSVVGQALIALLPLIQQIIVDEAIIAKQRALGPWLALLAVAGLVSFGLHYLRRFTSAKVSLGVQHDLRLALHRHVIGLDPARHDALSVGDVMSRAAGDVTLIQMFVNQLPLLVANLTLLTVSLAVMLSLSPVLSLVFVLFVPLFLFLAVRFRDKVFPASWNDQRITGEVAGVVDEAVSGVRVVKAFAQEERELGLLVDRATELFGSRMRTARLTALYSATLQALPSLAQFGVLLFGGWLALRGEITLGVFLAFTSYLVQLLAPVRLLSGMLATSQQARAGAERVLGLLHLAPTLTQPAGARPLPAGPGEIVLDRVTFGYPGQEPVLRQLSLRIAPGERLGIVGASGSGKTTLALLLARFYDPASGAVRIDGRNVRDVTLDSVRSSVSVVFDDSFLFSSSIRDNIAFARPDASDDEIEAAAGIARAHDFIAALPAGYATRVGERGYTLSGGQRQRIALARAALGNPRVLILDDATSAIDAHTENGIHGSLAEALGRRTTVLIAHRQSTLRLASRIVVLDGGRIVADGSHDSLLADCPLYRELLAGPELDESADLTLVEADTIDARAWPVRTSRQGASRAANVGASIDLVAAKSTGGGGGGGGGQRDLGGGRAAFVAATPELLAEVAALPAAHDRPEPHLLTPPPTDRPITLVALLQSFRGALLLGLALVALDAALTLAGPFLTGRIIDDAIVRHDLTALGWLAALFLGVQIAAWANARVMQVTTARTGEGLLLSLRVRLFAHLQRLSLDYFDREMGGRIMTRLTTDVEALAQLLQQGMLTALVSLLGCGGVMVVLFGLDTSLAIAGLAVLPILAIATFAFARWSTAAYLRARERISAVYATLQEGLAGVRITQAFVRQAHSHAHFADLSRSYRDARLRSMQLLALYFPFLQLLSILSKTLVLGLGASLIASGRITAGILVAVLLYLDQFFTPLQQLSQIFDQWIQARVSLARIRELLLESSSTPEMLHARRLTEMRGHVRFEGVRFAYRGGTEALRGVDLDIPAGESVALVGTSGAGKSTFVKLVARFYDPTAGRVVIDGEPLSDLALSPYRKRIGYVPQEPFLFSGTIRSNIAYARPEVSDLEVERAARAVGAHAFIASLPDGYLTAVTQGGRSLSAGQRQLLCLARAELVNPAIPILDEATANLDLASEAQVRRAMKHVAHGRTTLLIAHRLQTARVADRIVLLEEGRIIEQGAHEVLLARQGAYARLWQAFLHAQAPGLASRPRAPTAHAIKSSPAAI